MNNTFLYAILGAIMVRLGFSLMHILILGVVAFIIAGILDELNH